jgi:hypothetical protein
VRAPLGKAIPLVLAALLAVATAVLVQLKHRCVTRAAAQQHCLPKPLVALAPRWRALGAGLLLALALLLSVRFDAPSIGTLALIAALACMTYRRSSPARELRGPGRWLPLSQREAFEREVATVVGGALDSSTLAGKCVLLTFTAVTVSTGLGLFRTQPYLSLLTFMATVIAWPLLLTGRSADLPLGLRNRARQRLEWMYRRLSRDQRLRVHPMGRFGDGDSKPDEIRLKVVATSLPKGVLGVEIAAHGSEELVQLCVLLRVCDGSEAHRRWQHLGAFARGRTPDERVAIIAPSLASINRVVALVRALVELPPSVPDGYGESPRTRNNAAKSVATGSATSNPGKGSLPTQATRAA